MSTPLVKIMSVNPGAAFTLPAADFAASKLSKNTHHSSSSHRAITASRYSNPLWRENAVKLVLRAVIGVLFLTIGVMQTTLPICVLGLPMHSYSFGIAIVALSVFAIMGEGGRLPFLGLASLAVLALVSSTSSLWAHPTPLSALQLHLTFIYGVLAAMMVIIGPGRFTVAHLAVHPFRQ